MKFEEDVEMGGGRWSKPYVGTLPLYSLFEARKCFTNAIFLFDIPDTNFDDIASKTFRLYR